MKSLVLMIKVIPRAKKYRWQLSAQGGLKCFLTQPAVDGAANRALILALADELSVSPCLITIVLGHTSRYKRLCVATELSHDEVCRRLLGQEDRRLQQSLVK